MQVNSLTDAPAVWRSIEAALDPMFFTKIFWVEISFQFEVRLAESLAAHSVPAKVHWILFLEILFSDFQTLKDSMNPLDSIQTFSFLFTG